MKKIAKFLLLIIIMTFSFTISNVYAEEKITIESVTLEEKTDTTTELSEPTINGLNIGFDLSYSQVNDYAKYKIIINNPTNDDYQIDKESKFNSSDYLTYKYELDNNTNIIRSNSKLTMYITIIYKTEVSNEKLTNGKFIETNTATINVSNGKDIINPKTGNNILIIIFILITATIISFVLFKNTQNKKHLSIMVVSLLLIPIGIYALEKLQINVTTKITIDKTPQEKNCTFDGDMVQGAEYTNGIYTYRYKQDGNGDTTTIYDFLGWANIDIDGWGVVFTPVITGDELTDEEKNITEAPCTNINGKPVVSYDTMFGRSPIKSLDTTGWNTSKVKSMMGMFTYSPVENINFNGFDTSNVTNMSHMIYATYNLTNLDLSSFNTTNVTDMSYMFDGCSSLTRLNISNFDTSNVKTMKYMFGGNALTELDLSNFNTSKVTDMNYMFSGDSSLTNLNLSSFDTSKTTLMNDMFSGCSSLTRLDLSNFDTSNVTNMTFMFHNCSSLEQIYVSDLWNVSNVTNSFAMFANCTRLPGYNSSSFDLEKANYNGGYLTYKPHS